MVDFIFSSKITIQFKGCNYQLSPWYYIIVKPPAMCTSFIGVIVGSLILAILTFISNLLTIIIKGAYNYTGINLGNVSIPSCQVYHQNKLAYLYIILSSSSIITLFGVILAIPLVIILSKTLVQVKKNGKSDSQIMKIYNELPKILLSIIDTFLTIATLVNFLSSVIVYTDNNNCIVISSSSWKLVMVTSIIAFGFAIALYVLICIVNIKFQFSIDQKGIDFKDLQQENTMKKEEEEMIKKFQRQAKEYTSNLFYNNQDKTQRLLKNEQKIYDQIYPPVFSHPLDYQTSYVDQKQNKVVKQDLEEHELSSEIQEKQQNQMKIQNNFLQVKEQDNISEKFDEKNFELRDQFQKSAYNQQSDNLSPFEVEKISELVKKGYKICENDKKKIKLQNRYIQQAGKKQLEYKIRINFKKSKYKKDKMYKIEQSMQQKSFEKSIRAEMIPELKTFDSSINPKTNEVKTGFQNNFNDANFSSSEEDKESVLEVQNEVKNQALEDQNVIQTEVSKMLKVTLFDISEFHKKQKEPYQEYCPIRRYVEKDEIFDYMKMEKSKFQAKDKRRKRKQYTQEQLIYLHKKNYGENQPKDIKSEFNQNQYIRQERIAIFGQKSQTQTGKMEHIDDYENENKKKTKKKLIEAIRGKYND